MQPSKELRRRFSAMQIDSEDCTVSVNNSADGESIIRCLSWRRRETEPSDWSLSTEH